MIYTWLNKETIYKAVGSMYGNHEDNGGVDPTASLNRERRGLLEELRSRESGRH